MPSQAAQITITERQREIFHTPHDSVTVPSRLRQRASLILRAFDGLHNEDFAEELGPVRRQVGRLHLLFPRS